MTILTYHAVDPDWRAPLSVSPGLFAEHLEWISANRRVVSLEDALNGARTQLAHGDIALTFDDGFTSVADRALPLIRERGLPVTVFLVGKMLDGDGAIDWVERPPAHALRVLDREQIVDLRASGVRFGSHSHTHRDLTSLGYDDCLRDLRQGRDALEDLLQEPVTTLAYPFGRHDEHVRRAAVDAGFERAFAMAMPPRVSGAFAIPRVGVYPNDDLTRFEMKMHRWYQRTRSSRPYALFLETRDRLWGNR